jgi:hypothetical protein
LNVAEKNMEIVAFIGRRLREAVESGQASPLPDSIQLSLNRLSLKTGSGSDNDASRPGHPGELVSEVASPTPK